MRNLIAIMLAASFGLGSCVCEGAPQLVMEFDGVEDYVEADMITPSSAATYSAWVYVDQLTHSSTRRFIMETSPDFYGGSVGVEADNRLTAYTSISGVPYTTKDPAVFPLMQWVHVALTWEDNGTQRLYKDGIEVASVAIPDVGAAQTSLRIGTYRASDGRFWDGFIFLPRIHNRALSAAEIRGLYKQYGRNDLGDLPVVFPRKHDPSLVGEWTAPVLAADRNTGTVTTNDTPFIDASFERNYGDAQGGVTVGSYTIATPQNIPFTVLAQDTDDLDMTAATLTDADFAWREVATGTTTNGKTFDMGVAALGQHYVACSDWSAVTRLNWAGASVSADIVDFGIATGLTFLRLTSTDISGDLAAADLPSGLTSLDLGSTDLSGDLAATELPSALTSLRLYSTDIYGDLAAADLPSGLTSLDLGSTDLSGDLAATELPSALTDLRLYSTDIYGDLAATDLPVGLTTLYLLNAGVTYLSTSGPLTGVANNIDFRIDDNALPQSNVDNILVDLDTSGATGGSCNVGGSNAAPSATGLAAKLSLEGKGWTVTVTP